MTERDRAFGHRRVPVNTANNSARRSLDFVLPTATLFSIGMNLNFQRNLWLAIIAGTCLTANLQAEGTNLISTPTAAPAAVTTMPAAVTRDEMTSNYLQIQEQIHATQLAIEKAQEAAAVVARNNADTLAVRLQSLEHSVATERAVDADAARKTEQLTLFLAGAFGLAGLGIMLLMVYFQWRAFTQLAEISAQQHKTVTNGNGVPHLVAPGRAVVESSNAQLLDVIGQLEKRINELESGQRLLPVVEAVNPQPAGRLDEAQQFLDRNQPQPALDFLDKFLAAQPQHAEALVKKAVALEKLGRTDEALASCDRAIAADASLAIAHLHKGGLLNRLRRYDEALQCYEDALRAQDKTAKV
jgi:tetratricopeptide (TPR) repeat protein